MSTVQLVEITEGEGDQRLDRWFRRRFPQLSHVRLEKLLRTGQVRLDGRRAKAGNRVHPGQIVRVPPLELAGGKSAKELSRPRVVAAVEGKWLEQLKAGVLFRDADVLVVNKPSGLPVQGGSGIGANVDAMLDHFRFQASERPRLVHRLDRDTSGVLVLARNVKAARALAEAFRDKNARKTYWAIVAGVPKPARGRIDAPLMKSMGMQRERVELDDEGKPAVTYYCVLDKAGQRAASIALMPLTGRTHQLRAHCAAMGTPILGDRKYGGREAILPGGNLSKSMLLHARKIRIAHPNGGILDVTAPPPSHFKNALEFLGLEIDPASEPFADLKV